MAHRVFGVGLAQLMEAQRARYPRADAPVIVEGLSRLLVQNVHEEGLFRLCPSTEALADAESRIESAGPDGCLEALAFDVHIAASLLKVFLRRLPCPLLRSELYGEWLAAGELQKDRLAGELRRMVGRLDALHRSVLRRVIMTLRQIAQNAAMNRMSAKALAICIAPNLIWEEGAPITAALPDPVHALRLVMETRNFSRVVTGLIEEYDAVFAPWPGDAPPQHAATLWKCTLTSPDTSLTSMAVVTRQDGTYSLWAVDSSGRVFSFDTESGDLVGGFDTCQRRPLQMRTVSRSVWIASCAALGVWEGPDCAASTARGFNYALAAVDNTVWTSGEGVLRVWSSGCEGGAKLEVLREIPEPGNVAVALRCTGERVWSGGLDQKLRVYDARTCDKVAEIATGKGRIVGIVVSDNSVWTAHDQGTVCVWDPSTFERQAELACPSGGLLYHLEAVGDSVWVCTRDGDIHVWGSQARRLIGTLEKFHTDAVSSLMVLWNLRLNRWQVWAASWDSSVSIWDINTSLIRMGLPLMKVASATAPRKNSRAVRRSKKVTAADVPLTMKKPGIMPLSQYIAESDAVSGSSASPVAAVHEKALSDEVRSVMPPKQHARGHSKQTVHENDGREHIPGVLKLSEATPVEQLVAAFLLYSSAKDMGPVIRAWIADKGLKTFGDLKRLPVESWAEMESALGKRLTTTFRRVLRLIPPARPLPERPHHRETVQKKP
eukprot:m51a1_g3430 putative domain-containing protein (719) ;mRNA; r:623923-626465